MIPLLNTIPLLKRGCTRAKAPQIRMISRPTNHSEPLKKLPSVEARSGLGSPRRGDVCPTIIPCGRPSSGIRGEEEGRMKRAMITLTGRPVRSGRIAGLCLAVLLAVGLFTDGAAAAADPQEGVRSFYGTLLGTMQNGRALGQSGRYARLAPVVDRAFDIPSMTRLAIGPAWATLAAAQQQQLIA